jgi:hypothetical protein
MLGFQIANLLVPGDPKTVMLNLPSGTWELEQTPVFSKSKGHIAKGMCAETYFMRHPATMGSAADAAYEEVTPILLGASFTTGLAVTSRRSMPASDILIGQPRDQWPRDRSIGAEWPVVTTADQFRDLVEAFVCSWPALGKTEKALLLTHHWLDALAFWSLEDLYLSATTLLQIIVATEATKQSKKDLPLEAGLAQAATRMSIRVLTADFKDMRNELIHDGRLIGTRFKGPDRAACAAVVCDVLNWFDEYMHAALKLGSPRKVRFGKNALIGANAFSVF